MDMTIPLRPPQLPSEPAVVPAVDRDARLAMELVAQLRPREEVAQAYGLSNKQLMDKLRNPQFRTILKNAKEVWSSDNNVKERIRAKAGLLVEDSLLDIYNIVTNPNITPSVRNQSFSHLANVADVSSPDRGSASGGGFRVVINLPDKKQATIEAKPVIEGELDNDME